MKVERETGTESKREREKEVDRLIEVQIEKGIYRYICTGQFRI